MQKEIPPFLIVAFIILVSILLALLIAGLNFALRKSGVDDKARRKKVFVIALSVLAWLYFVSFLSTQNFLNNFSVLPPRMAFVLFPPMITVVILSFSNKFYNLIRNIPQHWLIAMHTYRLAIAIVFYILFIKKIIPVQMTFAGRNYDILIGISAPLMAWLAYKRKLYNSILIAWNLLGVILVVVLVVIAVVAAPFPFKIIHDVVINTMIAYFPFVLMPGFVVPLAFAMHVFSLKKSLNTLISQTKTLNDKWLRIIGVPLVTIFNTIILHPDLNVWSSDFLFFFLIALTYTALIWYGDRLIIIKYRNRFPGYEQTLKRFLHQFVFVAIFTILTVAVIDALLVIYVFHRPPTFRGTMEDILIGKIISYPILILYESIYFFQKWRENIFEAEELKRMQMQNRLDSLKNQVNPHFLFNCLSSLSLLIREDKVKANAFVHEMSQVYRYILQSNENDLATLDKEIQFINSYMFLQRIRFDDHVKQEINLPSEYLAYKIPSLTLQTLAENAIKHNIISKAKPLTIKISINGNKNLVVTNNLQKKAQLVTINNFGLKNISKRYERHGDYKIEVEKTETEFIVRLPLIESEAESDSSTSSKKK